MELEAEEEGGVFGLGFGKFQCLNNAVLGFRGGAEHGGEGADGLMVGGVDAQGGAAKDLADEGARGQFDGVEKFVGVWFSLMVE